MAYDPVLPQGATFADYVIDDVLARGGMGVVYRALQQQPRRRVALKLIAPERALDPAFRDRFLREMDALASLEHPNIVPIHAAGEWQGQLYLAMRLVDGPDLGAVIANEGPMTPGRALALLYPVGDALEAAHREGLVHRDVKPANILVDRRGAVYLTDFGLTKRSISATGPTMPGQAIGSPGYMSPEQFTTGLSTDPALAARTDQYALACVLYACLTGTEPYHRDTWEAAMWAHVYAPIPRLSERRPDLPGPVDAVMEVALAKDPAARFESITAFLGAFREAAAVGALPAVLPPAAALGHAVSSATPPPHPAASPAVAPPRGPGQDGGATVIADVPVPAGQPSPVPDAPAERRRLDEVVRSAPPPAPPSMPSPGAPLAGGWVAADGDATIVSPVAARSGWGSGGDTPPGATPPASKADPKRIGAIVAGIAIVVVAGLGLNSIAGGRASATRSPGPTTSMTAESTERTDPTPTTGATPPPSFDPLPSAVIATYAPSSSTGSSARAALIAMIPTAMQSSCFDLDVRESIARVGCRADGTSLVAYTLFDSSTVMETYYDGWISYYGITRDSGECTTTGEREWNYEGIATPEGRVFCTATLPNSEEAVVGWTHAGQLVVVEAFGTDVAALNDLWLTGNLMVQP